MSKGCGKYDMLVELACRFNWTPAQVARLDTRFVDELVARMNAETKEETKALKKHKRKRK